MAVSAIVAVVGAAASYAAGEEAADAAADAADKQSLAAQQNIMTQKEETRRAELMTKPYREAGKEALSVIREGIKSGEFGPDSFKFDQNNWKDPGYQFRVTQGLKALTNRANAAGNSQSGAQQKALMAYGQDMASQEYQNSFNRAVTEHGLNQQGFRDLQSIANSGQNATNMMVNARQTGANNQMASNSMSADAQANADITGGMQRASSYRNFADIASQLGTNYMASGAGQANSGGYSAGDKKLAQKHGIL